MAWIERRKKADGTMTYWVRDKRHGRQIVILAGSTKYQAEEMKLKYEIRRDLEKEGYDDAHAEDPKEYAAQIERVLDRIWGPLHLHKKAQS